MYRDVGGFLIEKDRLVVFGNERVLQTQIYHGIFTFLYECCSMLLARVLTFSSIFLHYEIRYVTALP